MQSYVLNWSYNLNHRAVRAERKQCPDTVTANIIPMSKKLLKENGSKTEGR